MLLRCFRKEAFLLSWFTVEMGRLDFVMVISVSILFVGFNIKLKLEEEVLSKLYPYHLEEE